MKGKEKEKEKPTRNTEANASEQLKMEKLKIDEKYKVHTLNKRR